MPHIHHPSRCGHWRFCCEQPASVMWQSRNSSNQCPPRTHTHTCCARSYPQHRCSPANQDLWNTHCKNHHREQTGWSINCCSLLQLHWYFKNNYNVAMARERPWNLWHHVTPPICRHFAAATLLQPFCVPFSTLLSFIWGCQMARVKPPPPHNFVTIWKTDK